MLQSIHTPTKTMSFRINVKQTCYGYLRFDTLEEAKEYLAEQVDLDGVYWFHTTEDVGEIEETEKSFA